MFFDENIFISTGFTARESLHSISCSIIADYVHNVRKSLSMEDICKSINCFSKYLLDQTIAVNFHHMCCRILLNLLDCIKEKQDNDLCNARELILKVLEIIVTKFESIAKTQVSYIIEKFVFFFFNSTLLPTFNYFINKVHKQHHQQYHAMKR